MANINISGIVLAGGLSSRMGEDKAFLCYEGQALLLRQTQLLLECGISDVMISGRPHVNYAVEGIPVLIDENDGVGPLEGIRRGLESMTGTHLLVIAVDMPKARKEFIAELRRHSKSDAGVVPVVDSCVEPLLAVYPKAALPVVSQLILSRGRLSVKHFVEKLNEAGLVMLMNVESHFHEHFINWNTPQELE